jgi:hypothetical protein
VNIYPVEVKLTNTKRKWRPAPRTAMTPEEAVHKLMTRPVIDVWPDLGVLFDVGRNEAYDMVRRGEIEAVRAGRLIKPISAPLRRKLKLESAQWKATPGLVADRAFGMTKAGVGFSPLIARH